MYKFLPNYDEHPTKSNYMVYTFRDHKMASYFEHELNERGIYYESSEDETKGGEKLFFFGIKKIDHEEVYKLNLITQGKYRKPFFGNTYVRIILTTLLIGLIGLAVIGFIKN